MNLCCDLVRRPTPLHNKRTERCTLGRYSVLRIFLRDTHARATMNSHRNYLAGVLQNQAIKQGNCVVMMNLM